MALASVVLAGCGLCGNDPLNIARSPNGRWEAVTYLRGCSAITGLSTNVSIFPVGGRPPAGTGNLLSVEGKHPFAVEWQGDFRLLIRGAAGVKPEGLLQKFDSISVAYVEA
jgi:hypothetical protein